MQRRLTGCSPRQITVHGTKELAHGISRRGRGDGVRCSPALHFVMLEGPNGPRMHIAFRCGSRLLMTTQITPFSTEGCNDDRMTRDSGCASLSAHGDGTTMEGYYSDPRVISAHVESSGQPIASNDRATAAASTHGRTGQLAAAHGSSCRAHHTPTEGRGGDGTTRDGVSLNSRRLETAQLHLEAAYASGTSAHGDACQLVADHGAWHFVTTTGIHRERVAAHGDDGTTRGWRATSNHGEPHGQAWQLAAYGSTLHFKAACASGTAQHGDACHSAAHQGQGSPRQAMAKHGSSQESSSRRVPAHASPWH